MREASPLRPSRSNLRRHLRTVQYGRASAGAISRSVCLAFQRSPISMRSSSVVNYDFTRLNTSYIAKLSHDYSAVTSTEAILIFFVDISGASAMAICNLTRP